jgi:hypothetical protein
LRAGQRAPEQVASRGDDGEQAEQQAKHEGAQADHASV